VLGTDGLEDEPPGQQERCQIARVEMLRLRNEEKTSEEGGCVLRVEQPMIQLRDDLRRTQCNLNSA